MSQLVIYAADRSVLHTHVPEFGQMDVVFYGNGYIVSPGYPGHYPNGADGKLLITSETGMVSLP